MNITAVNLNLLVSFEALLSEQNVGRAATRVGITQGAMSNALRKLRELFDDPLFIRTRHGMVPTPRARALSEPVRSGLAQLRSAIAPSRSFHPTHSDRTFTVATTDYAELMVLRRLMRDVTAMAPAMQIRVRRHERIFAAPENLLRAGAVDMAIGFFPAANALDSSMQSCDLFSEENVCIGRKDNPVMRPQRLTLQGFAKPSHIGIFAKPERKGLIDDLLLPLGVQRRLAFTTPHLLTVPLLVANSALIAVVPSGLAEHYRQSLRLAVRKLPFSIPPFCMRMIWHERFADDSAHAWLRNQIVRGSAQASAKSQ
ncbi:MAG: LysR family transcriptional regulator [Acidobacteria bacterium]|nr:LysR family transcriptional regulator [Acidobacteriota bacterium]MBV9436971.1 LysR family transcriptional regulator [Acidobacteriota bacterium]